MSSSQSSTIDGVAQLCPECGLCCNGVLFRDVELQAGVEQHRLSAHGVSTQRRGGKSCLPQPCACFDGRLCRIYEDRPTRCRAFNCGVLKRVESRELSVAAALSAIRQAQAASDRVRDLLRELGDTEETLPLTSRYSRMMARPIDLAHEREAELRSELMLVVNDLMHLLQSRFLQ